MAGSQRNPDGSADGTTAGGAEVQPPSFEDAMARLEGLVGRMESSQLPLEEALLAYQEGVGLVRHCRESLEQVSRRVRILEADLLQPFPDPAPEASDAH